MPDKCISSIEEEEPHTTLPGENDYDEYDDYETTRRSLYSTKYLVALFFSLCSLLVGHR